MSATTMIVVSWFVSLVLIAVLSAAFRQRGEDLPALVPMGAVALGFHGAVFLAVGRMVRKERRSFRGAFGLDLAPGRAMGLALGTLVVAAPVVYASHAGMGALLKALGQEPAAQSAVELLVRSGGAVRLAIAFFAVILAPMAEELLFRGLYFPALRDAGFARLAWAGTSLAFGAIHANLAAFVPLSLLGVYLAWLYQRTGNLLAPVTAHAVFNTIPFVMVSMGWDLPS